MQVFLTALLECSVVMSVISFAYIVAMPLLAKRYSSKWLYYIWFIIIVGWIFPFRPSFNTSLFTIQIPREQFIAAKYIDVGEPLKVINTETSGGSSISIWCAIVCIWAIGAIGIIVYNVYRHCKFLKVVNRWSDNIEDLEVLEILNTLKSEMKIETLVGLKVCPAISTPMMIGFFRPMILLPAIEIDSDELIFILRHELIHLKRNDLWYKALILLANVIHWFNPMIYIVSKAIAMQCEISCDEVLVKDTGLEERKNYGKTIIGVVRNGVGIRNTLSTNFNKDGSSIKTRIIHIMDVTKKKSGITVLGIALITIMLSGMVFISNPVKSKEVIRVDVESLESRKAVCMDVTYKFEEGDVIRYNSPVKGDNKNATIAFVSEGGKSPFQFLTLTDCYDQNIDQYIKVTKSQAGNYCLLIRNDEEFLSNIKGTIEIIKGEENLQHEE